MPFRHSIEYALADRIGLQGLAKAALDDTLKRSAEALAWLRARHADGTLPLLRLPAKHDDFTELRDTAARLTANATDVVILGTGGSSLGGQTLAQLAGHAVPGVGALRPPPRLHFMDNLDPDSYAALLQRLPLASSRFVAISKSGGTGETLMQTTAALAAVKAAGLAVRIPDLFLGLTEPAGGGKRGGLRVLLDEHRVPMLDHDPGVGGRYSVLTMMAYADRLERFTRWYVQLWAESLGKDGKGTTPIGALGPVDQHSQLQLYIAGPRDKLFTIVTVGTAGRGPRIAADLARLAGESDFAGKTIGDLVAAQGRATAETLAKNGCPVRTIHIERLDETSLGELLMHFMLETIIAAQLLGVDAFDQPAVEEGKILAKKYLAGG